MMVLYTKNNCSACKNVKAFLEREDYTFEVVNIEDDMDSAMRLISHGIRSVPVLEVGPEYLVGAEAIEAAL